MRSNLDTTEIEISVPLPKIFESLAHLPLEKQLEALKFLQQQVRQKGGVYDNGFLASEMGRYIVQEADQELSLEEVEKALSSYKGSVSDLVTALREER